MYNIIQLKLFLDIHSSFFSGPCLRQPARGRAGVAGWASDREVRAD